jgi:hypothetical protein
VPRGGPYSGGAAGCCAADETTVDLEVSDAVSTTRIQSCRILSFIGPPILADAGFIGPPILADAG